MSQYAGDITTTAAWDMVKEGAVLVDVRTVGEWEQVGVPDTAELGVDTHFIEWVHAGGIPNRTFLEQLKATGVEPGTPIVFLCRSGQRSIGASMAATAAGYGPAYNILDGFEGPANGWVAAGLPSRQF